LVGNPNSEGENSCCRNHADVFIEILRSGYMIMMLIKIIIIIMDLQHCHFALRAK